MPAHSFQTEHVADAAEIERGAINAAFYEFGLHAYWDRDTYAAARAASVDERDCVRGYLEREQPHLLRAYDAGFLADAVIRAKQQCRALPATSAAGAVSEWSEKDWEAAGF